MSQSTLTSSSGRAVRRGVILALVCVAQFMVILDVAIVNVALPSMRADLGLDPSDLQWVVITYSLTLGGLVLLGGRAADLLGRRAVLMAGLALFTAASLGAGLSGSFAPLVTFRGLQGLGAALTAPAALSTLVSTFPEGAERNKALGIFGAVGGSAATVGVIVSGLLTSGPGWEWIFLINVPVGLLLLTAVARFVPRSPGSAPARRGGFDLFGALSVTAGLMAIVYAVNRSVDHGWTSTTTLGFILAGLALLALFVVVEARASAPLVPLSMFRRRTLTTATVVTTLVFGSFFATVFQASLFMQEVLRYSALRTGVAYLAIAGTAFVVAGAVAARVVNRRGAGTALVVGQLFGVAGLLLLSRTPADASYWPHLFPGFLAVGVAVGFSGMALQVAGFIGVEERVSGLAGGMLETAREVGGAFGVAVVVTAAIARTEDVLANPALGSAAGAVARTEGFQRGSLVAAGFSLVALVVAAVVLRRVERTATASMSSDGEVVYESEPTEVPVPIDG